jgi:hypothetical protein
MASTTASSNAVSAPRATPNQKNLEISADLPLPTELKV